MWCGQKFRNHLDENEYGETVQLLSSSEVKECSEWAIKTIKSGYLALSTTTSTNFWNNNLFRTNVIQSLLAPEAPRFVLSLPSDFESPQRRKASRKAKEDNSNASNSRPKINIVETDNITIPGLDVSLMSFLKTNAANKTYLYHSYDYESKYRITSVMNNILDLTDISANKKSYSLNGEQLDSIVAAFPTSPPENWSHTLNKLASITEIADSLRLSVVILND
ncbi:uncharacterized protein EV154DRAFT_487035 [Mucor mucedo]|uniref:uncharacterized protein n=1 Tax=Mucor mucedo TaxID=29922 RepID=UPI0022205687|nr:uncharacterized protein EV154DRAFT_487035 [Mucor mucedo]KAI7873958.1 hypothetical protein EV154DRAFT_487035 [Mucor mucedo]